MLILATDTSAAVCCGAIYDTDKKQIIARTEINNKLTINRAFTKCPDKAG